MKNLARIMFIAMVVFFVAPALAQDSCTQTQLNTINNCLLNTCLPADPPCTFEDIDNQITQDNLARFSIDLCCNKKNKGLKLACFNRALNAIKLGRSAFPSSVAKGITDNLKLQRQSVRQHNSCII